jgi:hypothetical protein
MLSELIFCDFYAILGSAYDIHTKAYMQLGSLKRHVARVIYMQLHSPRFEKTSRSSSYQKGLWSVRGSE